MAEVADHLWKAEKGELIDRVRELEGLLAGTTRQLESSQRQVVELEELRDSQPTMELAELTTPAHLEALDSAIGRLAAWLADDTGMEADDLMVVVKDAGEPAVSVIASAIVTLAMARDRLSAKPLPPIERQGHLLR